MAQLPDSLPQASVDGARLPGAALPGTDFGLGQAADTAERVAVADRRARIYQQRAQDKADAEAVKPDVQKLREANAVQLLTDAGAWNGQPGFAADQTSSYRARATEAAQNPAYTPGQRAAFQHAADQETQRAGDAAISHEVAVIGQRTADRNQVAANGVLGVFQGAYAPAKQAMLDGYDGSQAGLTQGMLGAFDSAAQTALAGAPDNLKPALQARLSAMRTEEQARGLDIEQKSHDAFVLQNGTDQIKALANSIVSNPSAYDSIAANNIPAIVATLPAGMKRDAQRQFMGMAAEARITGLIGKQEFGQAQAELNDGRYDDYLDPNTKEQLAARVQAENRAHGPEAIDLALAGVQMSRRMQADLVARASTGKSTNVDLDAAAAVLSGQIKPEVYATWKLNAQAADQAFAATGPVRAMTNGQLSTVLGTTAPDPSDPDYSSKLQIWNIQRQAAIQEQASRLKDPAAWAFDVSGAPVLKGVKADGTAAAFSRGQQLQQTLQSWVTAADPSSRMLWGGHLAGQSLGAQAAGGIPATSWNLVPQAQAEAMAASVVNAAPEQKRAALTRVGGLIAGLPDSFQMPDGTQAAPRQILARQLAAARMTPVELSAAIDYGDNPAALGRVVAALNDPTLKKSDETALHRRALNTAVKGALQPFLNAAMPLPGQVALEQARIDRTVLTARELMATHGLSQGDAVRAAAADLIAANRYQYVDTWRMPQDAATPSLVRSGAALVLGKLTASGNVMTRPGVPPEVSADQVQRYGRWTPRTDDTGLQLMLPRADGRWFPVQDRWGRPISMSWQQLQNGADGMRPTPFDQPPPGAIAGPDGHPVPAFSRDQAFSALSWAVNGQESHFQSGLVSPKGALGQMQVTPDTVATYAPRLGLPVDMNRAQHDDAYNRQIGNAALQDYVRKYGAGAGLGLALAAYNWGPGNVDHAIRLYGDPRQTPGGLNAWIGHLPAETQGYLKTVLPAALGRLQGRD